MSIAKIVAALVENGHEDLAEELLSTGAGKWLGSNPTCDICGQKPKEWFVDGKTKMGPWALMCERDFPKMGVGIGPGRGQKYDAKTMNKIEGQLVDEELLSIAGNDPQKAWYYVDEVVQTAKPLLKVLKTQDQYKSIYGVGKLLNVLGMAAKALGSKHGSEALSAAQKIMREGEEY